MFADLCVEALLVNPELADQVWTLWHAGIISDEMAALAWLLISQDGVQLWLRGDWRAAERASQESAYNSESVPLLLG